MRILIAPLLAAACLATSTPGAAAPYPYDVLYAGADSEVRPLDDVRAIETQAELSSFYATYTDRTAPSVDFTQRRVLAFVILRPAICGFELAVSADPVGAAAAVTVATHEPSSTCLTALWSPIYVLSVPRFTGAVVFRSADDPTVVYGTDVTL